MKIAFVGTGFVADYYMTTLPNHAGLQLAGAWDMNSDRLKQFCAYHQVSPRGSLDEILADETVTIVVNLTTPESHFAINRAILAAGKHVYCEKPLATSIEDAEELVGMAEDRGLTICTAPANALSDVFGLVREQLDSGRIGQPRLVYAEMEDGPVFRAGWTKWKSISGAPWPGLHEFETGCTLEHAGYALSWLVGLFGPVQHVSAFAALTFPDKGPGTSDLEMAPDFSVGCLTFRSGVTARLTCGLAAPRDRSLTILGTDGTLVVRDLWDNFSPVNLAERDERSWTQKIVDRVESRLGRRLPLRIYGGKQLRVRKTAALRLPPFPSRIDFARGIKAQADGIQGGTAPFYSGRVALHLTELALVLNSGAGDHKIRNSFA